MLESRTSRVIAVLIAVALIVVLFVALSGNDEKSPAPAVPAATTGTDGTAKDGGTAAGQAGVPVIEIKNGQPVGGVAKLTFDKGAEIRFVVHSDTADEVHFHGYDIGKDIEAGGTVRFDVPADIDGIFEVELESTATQIAQITVNP